LEDDSQTLLDQPPVVMVTKTVKFNAKFLISRLLQEIEPGILI